MLRNLKAALKYRPYFFARYKNLKWITFLVFIGIYFCWDFLSDKKVFLHPDFYGAYFPFRVWFSENLLVGTFPLWNPSWGVGHPAEIWASIPLDFFTVLETTIGHQYSLFQLIQAIGLLVTTFLVLSRINIPPAIAVAGSSLFLISPWTNYFFYYFNHVGIFIAYILGLYVLYRWLETRKWKYLLALSWITFFGMLGTKLELWFIYTVTLIFLSLAGPYFINRTDFQSPIESVKISVKAVIAVIIGILAQSWQLAIFLPTMSKSGRSLPHDWSNLFQTETWLAFFNSLIESAFVQIALLALMLVFAMNAKGLRRHIFSVSTIILGSLILSLPTPFEGNSRDGGILGIIMTYATSPFLFGVAVAALMVLFFRSDKDYVGVTTTTVIHLLIAYYFCRTGRGDLAEVEIISRIPSVFEMSIGAFTWLGIYRIRDDKWILFCFSSYCFILLMRDQGQILLVRCLGWQWIPTRDAFIIELAFIIIACRGLTFFVNNIEMPRTRALAKFAPLGCVGLIFFSIAGNLHHIHDLVSRKPDNFSLLEPHPRMTQLMESFSLSKNERVHLSNSNVNEFPRILGSSLLLGIQETTIYQSLSSKLFRDWTIGEKLGRKNISDWKSYTNELTAGTLARLPVIPLHGFSNNDLYGEILVSAPPTDRGILELLGTKYVVRFEESGHPGAAAPKDLDAHNILTELSPKNVVMLEETSQREFVAELDPLPRAFFFEVTNDDDLTLLNMPSEMFAKDGQLVIDGNALDVYPAYITKYSSEEVVINYFSQTETILVLSDLFDSGWRTYINGEPGTSFRALHFMRGVKAPQGKVEVRFSYNPSFFFSGLAISGAIITLMVVGLFLVRFKNSHSHY